MPESDTQQQPVTGTSSSESTRSSTKEQLSDREKLFLNAVRKVGRVKLLGNLIGWESIRRDMKREDDLAFLDALAHHKAIHGGVEDIGTSIAQDLLKGDEEMGHIILGDIYTDYKVEAPKTPSAVQETQGGKASGLSKGALAGLLALATLGGGGLGTLGTYLVNKALSGNGNQPSVTSPEEQEIGILELGQPDDGSNQTTE